MAVGREGAAVEGLAAGDVELPDVREVEIPDTVELLDVGEAEFSDAGSAVEEVDGAGRRAGIVWLVGNPCE